MEYRVIVAPPGSGSTHLNRQLESHARADLTFEPFSNMSHGGVDNTGLKITDKPIKEHMISFHTRTFGEYDLDLNLTIEKNLVNYIDFMNNQTERRATLGGTISTLGPPFFTRNKTNGILAIIRHPLHSMVSLLLHQHPWHGVQLGGINSETCVKFYANQWNRLVSDLIAGEIKIIRFEYAKEDSAELEDDKLKSIFSKWLSHLRIHRALKIGFERMLKSLVEKNYFKLYEEWEI